MKLCVHSSNVDIVYQRLKDELLKANGKKLSLELKQWRDKRSIPQNQTMWMWNTEIANHIKKKTGQVFDPEDIHELLKQLFCPVTEITIGSTTASVRSTKRLDKSQMHRYLERVDAWAAEKGIMLTIPYGSQYQEMRDSEEM